MSNIQAQAVLQFDQAAGEYSCQGAWTILALDHVLPDQLPTEKEVVIDGAKLTAFDTAGALRLLEWTQFLQGQGIQTKLKSFNKEQQDLIELVQSKQDQLSYQAPKPKQENMLAQIGREAENKFYQLDGLIILVGDLSTKIFEAFGQWRRFQWPSIVSNLDSAGIKALPIVALLSFLIGVVLAYQMGLQLKTYGANIFIAYLSGMAIFREFAPLITAIIVAGRTSSAFTAQLGSMKINEEIDALLTMGLSPTELLVMPKVIAMLLVFPLLIFWADIFSVLGAMFMSKQMLDINHIEFLSRLRESVGISQFMLGMYKAPAFAIIVALVGCFQGFRVEPSADSVGAQTTRSVVQALFLIIVADAAFSVVYSWMGL